MLLKTPGLALIAATLVLPALPYRVDAMTKDDLIQLTEEGVPDDVVVRLVRLECVDFPLNADSVIELAAIVSSNVLSELIACAEKKNAAVPRDLIVPNNIEVAPGSIVVLPFSGDLRFQELAADTAIAQLSKESDITIIHPDKVRQLVIDIEGNRAIDGNTAPGAVSFEAARTVAAQVRGQYVLMGSITSYSNGLTLDSTASVKLIDTRSGQVLASAQNGSGRIFASSEMKTARSAVERAIKKIMPELREALAGAIDE
jgi:hypothetical protein